MCLHTYLYTNVIFFNICIIYIFISVYQYLYMYIYMNRNIFYKYYIYIYNHVCVCVKVACLCLSRQAFPLGHVPCCKSHCRTLDCTTETTREKEPAATSAVEAPHAVHHGKKKNRRTRRAEGFNTMTRGEKKKENIKAATPKGQANPG